MSYEYAKAPRGGHEPEEILKLIARVVTGRKILEAFLPLLSKGKVRIEAYPAEIVAKLREVLPADQPIGACFTVDPETNRGCVYLDFGSPIGVLAPFLVHEMVHALDPRVWKGHLKAALSVEEDAFQTQFAFTQELRERDADFDRFLRATFPKARILNELLEPAEIAALYSDDGRKAA